MPRKSLPVVLTDEEITRLEQWIRAGSTPQQVSFAGTDHYGGGSWTK